MNKVFTKFTKLSGLAMMTLALSFSCKEGSLDDGEDQKPGTDGTIPLPSITATFSPMVNANADTKITTTPDGKVSWDANDNLSAFVVKAGYNDLYDRGYWGKHKYTYVTNETDCQKNTFHPQDYDLPVLSEAESYDWYVISPRCTTIGNPLGEGNCGYVNFPDFKVDVDHPVAHLTQYDYMIAASKSVAVSQTPSFALEHKAALMKFSILNEDTSDMTIDEITFSVPEGTVIAGKFKVNFEAGSTLMPNGGAHDSKNIVKCSFVSFANPEQKEKAAPLPLKSGETFDLFVIMPPFTLTAGNSFTLMAKTSVGTLTRTTTAASDIVFAAGTINTADIKLKATHVESIKFEPAAIQLQKGDTRTILPTFTPANADNKNLLWESSNPACVSVDETGKLTALQGGTAVIKATTLDGGKTAECTVTVLALNKSQVVMKEGASETLEILNLDPSAGAVTWNSSNAAAVTVTDGTLNAVAPGYSEITATVAGLTFTAGVTVYAKNVDPIVVMYKNTPINLIYVQGGTFDMGSNTAGEDAAPIHKVTLDDYLIGQFEVTQELWTAVMGENPSKTQNALKPVENMKWDQIQEFLTKLSTETGLTFTLPTEAQWEFAARGGNATKNYIYSGSNTLDDVAWYQNTTPKDGWSQYPQIVGKKMHNELGIYDMSGNVREYCSDWYATYSGAAQVNPTGAPDGSNKILRGGCSDDKAEKCTVSTRYNSGIGAYSYSWRNGFRIVVSSPLPLTTPDWNPGNNGWFK